MVRGSRAPTSRVLWLAAVVAVTYSERSFYDIMIPGTGIYDIYRMYMSTR